MPALEEMVEEAGRALIEAFVCRRLIPMGCVRAAIDAEGEVCIARQRRLDAYFGREVAPADLAPAAADGARVVVQPDFSVIVIGLNPTAAAELAPFCERATGSGGRGATILKITRESVVKAVANGLKPAEITDRLRRHASNEVPANVLREVQDWSSWVRHVTPATLTVLRCPDRDTADRVAVGLEAPGRAAQRDPGRRRSEADRDRARQAPDPGDHRPGGSRGPGEPAEDAEEGEAVVARRGFPHLPAPTRRRPLTSRGYPRRRDRLPGFSSFGPSSMLMLRR